MSGGGLLLVPAPCVESGRLEAYPPHGLLSLQAVAADYGDRVDILLLPGEALVSKEFDSSESLAVAVADQVDLDAYAAIGLSTMGSSFHHTLNIGRRLKERSPRVRIWLGGPHASVYPRELLAAFPWIEAIFVGEGEETFRELLQRWTETGGYSPEKLAGVVMRGWEFSPRPPIRDLDSLPFVDRAPAFEAAVAVAPGSLEKTAFTLEAERGCPGRCTFCSTRLFWGSRPRRKSSPRLLEEMRRVGRVAGTSRVALLGDNLATPRGRLLRFCEFMQREASDVSWYASLKLDRLGIEDLEALRRGGCYGFFVGVESGSQTTLDRIRKGVDLARELEVIRAAIELGFSIDASFIVGFPWESEAELYQTLAVHRQLLEWGAARSMVSVLAPLPGTDLEREFRDLLHPGEGFSLASLDHLPYGPETAEMMNQVPESFTQLSYLEGGVKRSVVGAVMQVALLQSNYYRERSQT
jgi:radical SAM superfamily enzyme YgiQ (UPF0313 family)